jgi:hypothetical protein
MRIALLTLGASFTGVCVWLTVRLINRREKWTKRVAIGIVVCALAGYSVSYLTFCLLNSMGHLHLSRSSKKVLTEVYRPLIWICEHI